MEFRKQFEKETKTSKPLTKTFSAYAYYYEKYAEWLETNFELKSNIKPGNIDEHTLNEAMLKFGMNCQLSKAIEELTELSLALQHYMRDDRINGSNNIIDETADVSIMLEQLKNIFGRIEVEERIAFKMARLRERILKQGPYTKHDD